ncbi:hypothetical protein CRM22_001401 [Opisthorchis felineus]|uniref:Uncharacterized protein n=1 Tax=Opisthorchis felineus TaxID=147828 RepID=A0A4S2MAW2_OPIFE|nr:hypothetical protein CRM22_001401 [Opisthorchis felineus]
MSLGISVSITQTQRGAAQARDAASTIAIDYDVGANFSSNLHPRHRTDSKREYFYHRNSQTSLICQTEGFPGPKSIQPKPSEELFNVLAPPNQALFLLIPFPKIWLFSRRRAILHHFQISRYHIYPTNFHHARLTSILCDVLEKASDKEVVIKFLPPPPVTVLRTSAYPTPISPLLLKTTLISTGFTVTARAFDEISPQSSNPFVGLHKKYRFNIRTTYGFYTKAIHPRGEHIQIPPS